MGRRRSNSREAGGNGGGVGASASAYLILQALRDGSWRDTLHVERILGQDARTVQYSSCSGVDSRSCPVEVIKLDDAAS